MVILTLAAVKGHAVDASVKVDDNGISVGGGCIRHINLAGVLLLDDLQLVFDLQLGHLVRDLLRFDPHVSFNGDGGLHRHDGSEHDAVLVNGFDIKLCASDRLHRRFRCLQCLFVSGRQQVIGGILIEYALAVHPLDDGAGGLTLAEAGHGYIGSLLAVYVANFLVEGFSVHRKFQLYGAVFGSFSFDQRHDGNGSFLFVGESFFTFTVYFTFFCADCQ